MDKRTWQPEHYHLKEEGSVTEKDALFFAELWLSDKCNTNDDLRKFMEFVKELLEKRKYETNGID